MSASYTSTSVTLVALIFSLTGTSGQSNPCPDVLEFKQDNSGSYGVITIPAPGKGQTILNASIAIYGETYNSAQGGLKLLVDLDTTVANAQRGANVQYRLNFPQSNGLPIIQWITLNYKTICRGRQVNNAPTWSFQHSFTYPSHANYLSSPLNKPEQKQQPNNQGNSPWNFFINFGAQDVPTNMPNFIPDFEPNIIPNDVSPQPPTKTPPPVRRPPPNRSVTIGPPAEPDDGSWLTDYKYNNICGLPGLQQATHTIIGGEDTIEGEFPWIVAISHFKAQNKIEYVCGGSLISNKHILTAAHCTAKQNRVYLEIGRYNLDDISELFEIKVSQTIVEHPQYVPDTAHADIAIIITSEMILSNSKFVPVCLWPFGTNLDLILRKGIISGWGEKENGEGRNGILLKLGVEKTTLDVCQNSHELFQRIATDKTFCAGGNDSGPCHGDSGSGFYIQNRKKWYLRGIISTSIGHGTRCNVNQYSVYADVAFFLDWIRSIIT